MATDGTEKPATPAAGHDEALAADPVLDDERTDRAVDDIVAHESDEILQAQDDAIARAEMLAKPPRRGFWRSIGHGFKLWLGTAKGRWVTFMLLVLMAAVITATPQARYWVLNTAGVRAGASVTVVDELTRLPLKGVQVTLAGATKKTGADGNARFTGLRLGQTNLKIEQPGFADISRNVTLGWGSNPFRSIALTPTGERYAIHVRDQLSGEPLPSVLATAGDATALSDDAGKIELTLEDGAAVGIAVTLSKDGYRTSQVTIKPADQLTTATMLSSRKAVFISKASGKYDLYKSDLDGNNRELLLAGTGMENGNFSLATSLDGSYAALVSTRDNQQDADGFLLNTVTLVRVDSGTAVTLGHAAQIQLIDWVGSRLIFMQVSSDPKTAPANRQSIISYDYLANSRVQLAAAPKLASIFSAQGAVYYGIADDPNNGSLKPGFYKVHPDGSGRQTAYAGEVWSGLRTDYHTLALQTEEGWVLYNIQDGSTSATNAPPSFTSRLYRDNADHSRSLWVSQGTLMLYDVAANKDTPIQTHAGLNYPVQWLGNNAVYRLTTSSETADYVTALLPGKTAHKVADVTNSYGFIGSQ